ncbi:gamma-glutamyltransferase [Cokeromyces recurvatus]|uniref:gamma-glutamyltransferase n=1 Tax=Cokeromyces recurvatus TaxID=90255 RepID=UPI00221F1965|nr:gamma-glutamyltransferase [Cokeromyces recurvatus]KAI7899777.1 gamma-glutamyltransferase [Cokeromyces recurvatus]
MPDNVDVFCLIGIVYIIICFIINQHKVEALESPVKFKGHLVKGSKAAVAVEAEECSNVGIEILKKGGNAVDAAIASTLCIGVIHSFATGGFMLIRSPNGTFEYIDFRETAPMAAKKDMFIHNPLLAQIGGLSVAVPGEIRGLELAHQRHGKLSWYELFEPSIRIARNGFKATELLEIRVKEAEDWMKNSIEWSKVYFHNGKPIKKGDIVKRPNLANTLDIIAQQGADAFYKGEIAHQLVDTVQSHGGILTLQDLENYQAIIRKPLYGFYHGRKVITTSEPTSGPVLLSVLNLIERFEFNNHEHKSLDVHRLIEAFKFGYAFRTELADPDVIHHPERIQEMISKDYAAYIRHQITDNSTHEPLYYHPKFDHIDSHGTMHLSVVDEENGAVALTSTINLAFGSHIMDPTTGIILNDEMDDFSIPGIQNMFGLYPSKYNYASPGKRPLSSITPTIIEKDTKFELAIGASGGSFIPTATLNVSFEL